MTIYPQVVIPAQTGIQTISLNAPFPGYDKRAWTLICAERC